MSRGYRREDTEETHVCGSRFRFPVKFPLEVICLQVRFRLFESWFLNKEILKSGAIPVHACTVLLSLSQKPQGKQEPDPWPSSSRPPRSCGQRPSRETTGTRVRWLPTQDTTAHVMGNAYVKVLSVWGNAPICPNNQSLCVCAGSCRDVTKGVPKSLPSP